MLARDGCNGVVDESDVVARDENAVAFISPRWWPNNYGRILDVWHFHVHVFPRYAGDGLYASKPLKEFVNADQRRPYAERLRSVLTPDAV